MSDWTLAGVRIFVQDEEESVAQIIARLQPLNSLTVHQIFGEESEIVKINALVVSVSGLNTLKACTRDAAIHNFTGPYNISYSGYVHTVSAKLTKALCQNFDLTAEEDSPVYAVDIEFYRENA